MLKYIKKISDFSDLFEKLHYENEKYWATYTAMIFKIYDEKNLKDFEKFLLKYIRITDHIFEYSKTKLLVILEETTIKWAFKLHNDLKNKISKKEFLFDFYSSAIQWDFIETEKKLLKGLIKRIKIATKENSKNCVHSLSTID